MDTFRILQMEGVNQNCIYLHREGTEWYAYESSAFYLNSAFPVRGNIEQVIDRNSEICLVRISLGRQPREFFTGQELISRGEDMVEVKCKLRYRGFRIWKSRLIN